MDTNRFKTILASVVFLLLSCGIHGRGGFIPNHLQVTLTTKSGLVKKGIIYIFLEPPFQEPLQSRLDKTLREGGDYWFYQKARIIRYPKKAFVVTCSQHLKKSDIRSIVVEKEIKYPCIFDTYPFLDEEVDLLQNKPLFELYSLLSYNPRVDTVELNRISAEMESHSGKQDNDGYLKQLRKRLLKRKVVILPVSPGY